MFRLSRTFLTMRHLSGTVCPMNIGDVLKNWRLMEKMTLREACKRVGVSHPTLQRIEQGKSVDGATMWKILAFLFG